MSWKSVSFPVEQRGPRELVSYTFYIQPVAFKPKLARYL